MIVLGAAAGNLGWHNLIMRAERYAPDLSNYACTAGERTFPSTAGFHTSELFFTDDKGVYFFETRDSPALAKRSENETFDVEELLKVHRTRVRKIADGRLKIPPETPYVEAHNTWVVNHPESTLIIPVTDLAQHVLVGLCYYTQNGVCFYNDVHGEKIPGLERFGKLVDAENPLPLSFLETWSLSEVTAELSIACYAGMLMLQAIGLGGWMSMEWTHLLFLEQVESLMYLALVSAMIRMNAGTSLTLRGSQGSLKDIAHLIIKICMRLLKLLQKESLE